MQVAVDCMGFPEATTWKISYTYSWKYIFQSWERFEGDVQSCPCQACGTLQTIRGHLIGIRLNSSCMVFTASSNSVRKLAPWSRTVYALMMHKQEMKLLLANVLRIRVHGDLSVRFWGLMKRTMERLLLSSYVMDKSHLHNRAESSGVWCS